MNVVIIKQYIVNYFRLKRLKCVRMLCFFFRKIDVTNFRRNIRVAGFKPATGVPVVEKLYTSVSFNGLRNCYTEVIASTRHYNYCLCNNIDVIVVTS